MDMDPASLPPPTATPPPPPLRAHQAEALAATCTKRAFALLMDPGLGKTRVVLDTAAALYTRNPQAPSITAVLVLAPNDVHRQWVEEQAPLHFPRSVPLRTAIWDAGSTTDERDVAALLRRPPDPRSALTLLAMNHEALATDRGRAAARKFLQQHRALLVLDESHEFRTPSAKRTRAALALAPLSTARRILTGTLTGGCPFDLYSQFRFLDPRILRVDSFLTFKHRYATWTSETTLSKGTATSPRKLVTYDSLNEYRDLDQLQELIAPYCFVRRKEDCADLPPKIYVRRPTHLSSAQLSVYERLLEDGVALLERGGGAANPRTMDDEELEERISTARDRISYKLKLTLLLRLQQCVAGFTTDDAGHTAFIHPRWQDLPRAAAAVREVQQALLTSGKCIVWAYFRPALELLHRAFAESGIEHELIHGDVTGEARRSAIARFKDPHSSCRTLLAHPRTLGTGQNFEVASTVVYYTRSFSLISRTQSEDRAHRLSSRSAVTIVDLHARNAGTDARELEALAAKRDFAATLEPLSPAQMKELLRPC